MGTLVFQATLGGAVNIIGPNIANTINFTLPSADGSSGQTWTTNGSGVLAFGTLGIAGGGTGQITATAAFNALAPSQSGQSGKYLTTDGTNTSWGTNPLGTVTSVAATVPSFLSISGSPITTSGTLAFSLSGTALPTTSGGTGLTSFTSGGVVYASSTSALATGSALTFDGTNLTLANTAGVTSNLTTNQANGTVGSPLNLDLNFKGYINLTMARIRSWDESGSTGYGYLTFWTNDGTTLAERYRITQNGTAIWNVAGSEQMRLTSTGLGIGTTSPQTQLAFGVGVFAGVKTYTTDGQSGLDFYRNSVTTQRYLDIYATASGNDASAGGSNIRFLTHSVSSTVSATERMIIDRSGNVGIGTSSPAAKLDVLNSVDQTTLKLYASNASYSSSTIFLGADRNTSNNTFYAFAYYNYGAGAYKFRVADSGSISTAGSISLGASTPATSGIGVQFPATQSASSDANTLDDYEEGTWTPSDGSGAGLSLTVSNATYTKIGRMVYASALVTYPVTADTSQAKLASLPFAVGTVPGTGLPNMPLTSGSLQIQINVKSINNADIDIYPTAAGVTNAQLSGVSFIAFTLIYPSS